MRRRILICMILALILTVLPACGQQSKPEIQPVPLQTRPAVSAEDKALLLENWETYLDAQNTVQTHILWVMDYLDAFASDNSWNSLLKARAACFATEQALEKAVLPEFTLTDDQYKALQAGGIDVEMVKTEYLGMKQRISSDISALRSLTALLRNDVFYTAIADGLPTWSEVHRSQMADTAEYLRCATNYLLLQLDMPEVWVRLPGDYPLLFGDAAGWNENENALMETAKLALDRYEERFETMNDFLGRSEYVLKLVKEALETKNLEYLAKEIHMVEGVPCDIPIADWLLDDVDLIYMVTNPETQKKQMVQSGAKIEEVPSACYVECDGISLEEVQQYAQQLADWGFKPYADWVEQDKNYQVFLVEGETKVMVQWSPENTIYYMSGELGHLATELYMLAKTLKQ